MTIQPISDRSAALYLTADDLTLYGITPQQLTLGNTASLARNALLQARLPLWEEMEIEVYPNASGALVFVHSITPQWCYFSFLCWEHLLAATKGLSHCTYTVDLIFYDNLYWLAVAGEEANGHCALSEFGTQVSLSALDWARIAEYGQIIFEKAPFTSSFTTFFV